MNQSPARSTLAGGGQARLGRRREVGQLQPDLALAEQLGEGPGCGHPSPVEDDHPVADPLDLADQVRVEQHGDAPRPQGQHDVAHVDPAERIQRAGRFVQDHELGPGHQGDRQPEALLHALREAAHAVAGPVGQAHQGQAVALLLRGHVDARQADVEDQHLGRAQPRLVPEELRQVADAGPGGRIGRRPPEEHHLARIGVDQAEEHLDHRGLAGAVRTEQPDDLARGPPPGTRPRPPAGGRTACAGPSTTRPAPAAGRRPAALRRRRRPDGGGLGHAHRSSLAIDTTSPALSEPATTVTTPSSTHTTAASRRSRLASTVAGTPSTCAGDVVIRSAGTGSGRVEPSAVNVRSCLATFVGQAGERQQVVADRLERDAGGEGRGRHGPTHEEGGHAGRLAPDGGHSGAGDQPHLAAVQARRGSRQRLPRLGRGPGGAIGREGEGGARLAAHLVDGLAADPAGQGGHLRHGEPGRRGRGRGVGDRVHVDVARHHQRRRTRAGRAGRRDRRC